MFLFLFDLLVSLQNFKISFYFQKLTFVFSSKVMSFTYNKQLSTKTLFDSVHMSSWVIFTILCTTIIFIVIILVTILCFCYCFPRRHRSKNRAFLTSNHANIYSSSSLKKRFLSFNGSNHIVNMVPLECEVIRPSNFCENELENLSNIRQNYSRICHWFSMREIIEATNNFHSRNLIGVGCYGKVYRGFLFDGTQVAVKELTITR